jgi:uncharacterized protein
MEGAAMHSSIAERLPQLRALCRRYHVARLELFGSATGDAFDPAHSDLDFVVEYLPDPQADALEEFFGFKAALQALFGRSVDLVEASAVRNRYFREELEQSKVPLYAA